LPSADRAVRRQLHGQQTVAAALLCSVDEPMGRHCHKPNMCADPAAPLLWHLLHIHADSGNQHRPDALRLLPYLVDYFFLENAKCFLNLFISRYAMKSDKAFYLPIVFGVAALHPSYVVFALLSVGFGQPSK